MYINMTKKGTTWDELKDKAKTYSFRQQHKRTLAEFDTLILRQQQLKRLIGEERAAEIEADPDLFDNMEKFRIWQAKARWRSGWTALFAVPIIFTYANGGRNGFGLMLKHKTIAVATFFGTWAVGWFIWHRIVGYSTRAYNEQLYARNTKMLRNALIKQ